MKYKLSNYSKLTIYEKEQNSKGKMFKHNSNMEKRHNLRQHWTELGEQTKFRLK